MLRRIAIACGHGAVVSLDDDLFVLCNYTRNVVVGCFERGIENPPWRAAPRNIESLSREILQERFSGYTDAGRTV